MLAWCAPLQAYELVQGNLVRFSGDAAKKTVPTAVLVHGILGSRRNLQNFANLIVKVRGLLQDAVSQSSRAMQCQCQQQQLRIQSHR